MKKAENEVKQNNGMNCIIIIRGQNKTNTLVNLQMSI